jgi:hypothetical protein
MLIYQLSRSHSAAELLAGEGAFGDGFRASQRRAILAILSLSVTLAEYDNVIQHIHLLGSKASDQAALDKVKKELTDFMGREAIIGADLPFYQPTYLKEMEGIRDDLKVKDIEEHRGERIEIMRGWFELWSESFRSVLTDKPLPRGYLLPTMSSTYYDLAVHAPDHPRFDASGLNAAYESHV